MTVFTTLGFAAATDKQPGDYVASGGVAYRILEVVREGRNWPYYRLENFDPYSYLCLDAPGLVSWQCLGDAREDR